MSKTYQRHSCRSSDDAFDAVAASIEAWMASIVDLDGGPDRWLAV